ncbi:MAG: hypothetical protein ACTH31_04785 [Pseudoclavibacter sp.]
MAAEFQVVLEWGALGVLAAPARVTIVADARGGARGDALVEFATAIAGRAAGGDVSAGDSAADNAASGDAAVEARSRGVVLRCDLDGAADAAKAAYEAQLALGDRALIAIIATGDAWPGRDDDSDPSHDAGAPAGSDEPEPDATGRAALPGPRGGGVRPSAADELVAGAVVDALCEFGIDFHSPACAIASAAYTSLCGAARSLIRAEAAARQA